MNQLIYLSKSEKFFIVREFQEVKKSINTIQIIGFKVKT